jgi:hypothetical protein
MPSVMQKGVERAMAKWAKKERAKLSHRIRQLIMLAIWDLYYGPIGSNEDARNLQDETKGPVENWPGYSKACDEIRKALDDLPSELWIDLQCEEAFTDKPEGEYLENPDYDPEDEDSEEKEWCEPNWEDFYMVELREIKAAIVGDTELVNNL